MWTSQPYSLPSFQRMRKPQWRRMVDGQEPMEVILISRLDRLFLLLETGSSPLTRKAAAVQIGEVQKLHPHELYNLLAKVRRYLYSNNWDTRIAAGQAVEAIVANVPEWNPPGSSIKRENSNSCDVLLAGRMRFSEFDINTVIQHGSDLLACENVKIDVEEPTSLDPQEHLAKQRQILNKHLGLTFASFFGIDINYLSNEDLVIDNTPPIKEEKKVETNNCLGSRVFKTLTKSESSDSTSEPPLKKRKSRSNSIQETNLEFNSVLNISDDGVQWPLESFSDILVKDLLHPSWEVRHGSATALREIVRLHGRSAGKRADVEQEMVEKLNEVWLEDLALRLACVLALDKFGDFLADQVVAPVRETCAQVLGTVANIMSRECVEKVLAILLQLLKRPEWEARHGGLLGLKYILSVRKDMKEFMIPMVFKHTCSCLQDSVDDVSAVAASALVPVTNVIINTLPQEVPSVITSLWDALLDLDDLTVSTSSILQLLASLLSYSKDLSKNSIQNFEELVPRLWPFLSHNSSVVRKSVLQALITLTSMSADPCSTLWGSNTLQPTMQLLFQRSLVEPVPEIHDLLLYVWENMISQAPLMTVGQAATPLLSAWLSMLMQPSNVPFDTSVNIAWLDVPHKLTVQ